MNKGLLAIMGLLGVSVAQAQTTVKGGWEQFGIQKTDTIIKLNRTEIVAGNKSRIFYGDARQGFDISLRFCCHTLGTEQVFLCKDGKGGEKFADLSIGYDNMQRHSFVEVKDEQGILHRFIAGEEIQKDQWYDLRATAQYDANKALTTLRLSVNGTVSQVEYPGTALPYTVSRWVVGHGFPGGFPNSLQVLNGEMSQVNIAVTGIDHQEGENPIFTDRFTADPACTVIGNRIYAYVGEDKAGVGGWFYMPHWVCYSSDDMVHWTNHGVVLKAGDFPNANPNGAWAGQVVECKGKFYYYVTLDDKRNGKHMIDVAVSDSPTGPFRPARKDGTPLITDDMTTDSHRANADIDPTVFIDDDGTPWMAWGNGDCYMVRLKKNMIELDGDIRKVPFRNYSEGPWLFKRGEYYYMVYAADAPGVQPEQMAYSYARNIEGPWTYGSLLTGPAKYGFTIHPSVNEFKGQWYFFYHDGSYMLNGEPGGDCRRQVCVERLYFNEDGTIQPITLTRKGLAPKELPILPPMPEVQPAKAVNTVKMGDSNSFPEVQLDIPIADGPFKPDWASIEKNYPGTPKWLREAKIGFWVHFGPQAAGESGDWYARNLYKQEHKAYQNHVNRYGHPSEVGYKDVLKDWNPTKLDPEALTALYQKAGARFLMIQGVHHDNYDLWNSRYQPWNSVNVGPKRDLLREWVDACHKYQMHYGVTFHHEYTWWWWQTAFGADKTGPKAGIPYDGQLKPADGKGKWWEGLDPRRLYGIDLREYETVEEKAHTGWSPAKAGIFSHHLDYAKWYATQWALRMMDVVRNYDPDFIYTDGTVQGPFTGNGTGTGYKCNAMQTVLADYYNQALQRRGEVNTFSIIKFRKPTNGAVNTAEFDFPDTINTSQPWIREAPVGDWFYAPGFTYDAGSMIRFIIEAISRDGNVALNIPMRPDGSIEDACVTMLEAVGRWLDVNGEAVYGSYAWTKLGEGEIVNGKLKTLPGGGLGKKHAEFKFTPQDIRFTVGKNGALYAFCMAVPQSKQTICIKSLAKGTKKIKSVRLLGHNSKLKWRQTNEGLEIICPKQMPCQHAIVFNISD